MEAMEKIIEDAAVELIRRAVTVLPPDVVAALETARASETETTARRELGIMIENVREAGRCTLPMCQDTGIPVFFVRMGRPARGRAGRRARRRRAAGDWCGAAPEKRGRSVDTSQYRR